MFGGMPGGNEIQLIVSAVDNASNKINKISDSLSTFQKGIKIAAAASGALLTATATIGAAVVKLTREYTTYADQVRDMMRLTGMGAEASSRMIQVADDLKISYGEMSIALKYMVRQGLDPSIDSLAKLSDEYLTLQPGLERSAFLMEKFGRSGVSMAEMMEQGSAALVEMNGNIDENLILTQANVDAAREYEKAMDDLQDSWQGVKYSAGAVLIPALTDIVNFINNESIPAWKESFKIMGNWVSYALINFGTLSKVRNALAAGDYELAAAEAAKYLSNSYSLTTDYAKELELAVYNVNTTLQDYRIDAVHAGVASRSFTGGLDEATAALGNQYVFMIGYARTYEGHLRELAVLEDELIEARQKGGSAAEEVSNKIVALNNKQAESMENLAIDAALAAAQIDNLSTEKNEGLVDEGEYEFITGLASALGQMSDEAMIAALKIWDTQAAIAAVMAMPPEIRKSFIFDVQMGGLERALQMIQMGLGGVTEFYNPTGAGLGGGIISSGTTQPAIGGMSEIQRASASKFWASQWHPVGTPNPYGKASGGSGIGWGIVGDARDGHRTGYEEAIYAPGGYTVYPTSSSVTQSALYGSAPSHAGGGSIPPAPGSVDLSSITIRELARAIGAEMGRMNG